MLTFSKLGQYGRFGNQLFQIASTIGIALRNGMEYTFPRWEYQNYFDNHLPNFTFHPQYRYIERSTGYNEIDLNPKDNWDLEGYFQSYKYFENCKDVIRHYFTPLGGYCLMGGCAIHVRRGDYLQLSHIHTNLTMDYYLKAMDIFPKNTHFLVYSDDMDWCVKNFPEDKYITFGHSEDPVSDFLSMTMCDNFIIANSSFSWWGAYLCPNPKKIVVAPLDYVKTENNVEDRIPPEWITI